MSATITIGAEYFERLMQLADVAERMSKRIGFCGYHDPSLAMMRGEVDSHLDDLRELEKKGEL